METGKNERKYNDKNINRLLIECGGRCMICNADIMHDDYTKDIVNLYERAHINAANDNGPRADNNMSYKERNEVDNLMILCPKCHTKIDKQEAYYTADLLRNIKQNKLKKVRKCLDSLDNTTYMSVKYVSPIKDVPDLLTNDTINKFCFNAGYFLDYNYVDISDNLSKENPKLAKEILDEKISNELNPRIKNCPSIPVCLFASAPQYLLIELGFMINNLQSIKIFTKHRNNNWICENSTLNNNFNVVKPNKINGNNHVVLVIESSAEINENRIFNVMGNDVDVWKIKANKIGLDNINSLKELDAFRLISTKCMDEIYKTYGSNKAINVFPIMCNSLAVEFGRAIMRKSHSVINIYDMNKDEKKNIQLDQLKLVIE